MIINISNLCMAKETGSINHDFQPYFHEMGEPRTEVITPVQGPELPKVISNEPILPYEFEGNVPPGYDPNSTTQSS